jgi:general secretion pathway protein C
MKDNKLYIRKTLFISKLALVLLLGYIIVRIVLLPKYTEKSQARASAQDRDKVRAGETTGPLGLSFEDYVEIVERNPFGTSGQTTSPSKQASKANSPVLERSVSEELGLALSGTVSGSPALARAIIKDLKTGVLELYRTGQTVADAHIKSIEKDAVILLHNGERKILRLTMAQSGSYNNSDARVLSSRAVTKISKAAKTNLPTEQEPSEVQSRTRPVETIWKKAFVDPYAVDDQIVGLRITGLENIKAAKNLGLKNGDVVRLVNGHQLTSKQKAYQIFKKARSQAVINVELLRDEKIKKLSFDLR